MFSKRFIIIQSIFLIALAICLGSIYVPKISAGLPVLGRIQDFQLTDSNSNVFNLKNLEGKTWIANFFFTTCSDICPMMSSHMGRLSQAFKSYPDVRLISLSVNPENDTPEVLQAYAKKFQADSRQWIFLTGSRESITKLAVDSFKLGDMKEPVFHSSYFTLVDKQGRIRGYYDSLDVKNIDKIVSDLKRLRFPLFPTINASLNALAGIFLFLGFLAIKRKDQKQHRAFMLCAFFSSAVFLCAYIYYHTTSHVITRYQGQGMMRNLYFFILGTHTPLAVLIVPFIIMAIRYALKGEFVKHTKITRWLYPAWIYVSITGVLIYLMLYVF